MITIETLPDNWQGAFGEVLYTVKSDEEELQITEVSVAEAASSDLLGIKRSWHPHGQHLGLSAGTDKSTTTRDRNK